MEIINVLGLIATCGGILLALFLFHSKVSKKLDNLIEREKHVLTHTQAIALTDLYLSSIQAELRSAIPILLPGRFPDLVRRKDVAGTKREIDRLVNELITKTRDKVAYFRINGDQSFKEFLDIVNPINEGIIDDAKVKALKILKAAFEEPRDHENLESELGVIAEEAREKSAILIKTELQTRYPQNSTQ